MRNRALEASPAALVKNYLIYSLFSAVFGVGISFLAVLGQDGSVISRALPSGAIIGITISTVIFALELGVVGWLDDLVSVPRLVFRIPHYLVGGMLGFILGERLSGWIFGIDIVPDGGLRLWLPFIGIFSLVAGLLIYAYEAMRTRLEESVVELKEREFAQKELELARSIQTRLLPPRFVEGEGYSVAARNLAAAYVAGDFYDIFQLGNGGLGLVVADVAGKGMGASLIMASTKAMLPFIAAENDVAATLQILSERLAEDLSPREFVALAFAPFSVADRVVEIANAGLPDPYLVSSEGAVTALEVPGGRLPLGARRGIVYESRSWQLDEGDRLLMFSDGLPEARVDGSPLGYEGLAALLPRTDQAASSWIETLFGAVKGQTEEELSDDWTALVLHIHRV